MAKKCLIAGCTSNEFMYYKYCKKHLEERKGNREEENTVERKIEKEIEKNDFEDFRKKWDAKLRTEDGHYVRSKAEQLIDNWLYNKGIVHAYEKRLPIEDTVYTDFFIPIGTKVYIEYWGLMEDEEYKKRREAKIKYYKDHNKNLIELFEKDIENLDDVMPIKLSKYLPKLFNFD